MASATPWKACLLTALALLAAVPGGAASPPDNADDGGTGSGDQEPCPVLIVGLSPPYVDPHPECVQLPP